MVTQVACAILRAFNFIQVHINISVQMHFYKNHLNWEFLYHPKEQWVLFDIKFATSGEPDHVSIPALPIA